MQKLSAATPSIVMISIDALRADCTPFAAASPHLQSLGLPAPSLPTFSDMTRDAAVFTQAIACSSYTTACHASLLTGLLPPEHGVRGFSTHAVSSEVRTLAEILSSAGYAACGLSDRPIFFQPEGLWRGFQTTAATEDEALAWWDSYAETPRFLFMHLWDVHHPYGTPAGRAYHHGYPELIEQWKNRLHSAGIAIPEAEEPRFEDHDRHNIGVMQIAWHTERGFRAAMEDYIAGVEAFDRGRLKDLAAAFRQRGILDEAIMIISGDHGEGRDVPPSRIARHGTTLKDDQIRIPLFLRIPGLSGRRRLIDQVSQADIMPTLLDAIGLLGERTAPHSPGSGRSLLPLLRGEALAARPAYAETSTVFKDPALAHDDPASQRQPTLRYRIVRYPDAKYTLVGQAVTAGDDMLAAPDGDFVHQLFTNGLGRRPGDGESSQWLQLVQSIPAGDPTRRRALVERFEQAGEFKHLPKYAIFDLQSDPLENKPIDARRKPADWAAYQQQLAIIAEIGRGARAGEPLLTNEADEQVILRRLQDLGYVE
jgi:arylsulfatase A-like enzyme